MGLKAMKETRFDLMAHDGHRGLTLSFGARNPDAAHLFGLRGPRPLDVMADYFGIPDDRLVVLRQVHGDSIGVVEASPGGDDSEQRSVAAMRDQGHDAVITDRPGLALTVRTADCLPILIWDETQRVVGAVHAGWRGSLMAIASKTVRALESRFGSRPRDLRVGIGPAIGPCCFEVDGPVLGPLRERFDFWSEVVREKGPNKGMLDLSGLNIRQLVGAGVPIDRITAAGACTVCHPERFYSYRRDGHSAGGMINGIMVCAG